MQLLSESELIWSPVVANSSMNRERNATGINSYEKEFKFSPEQLLASRINAKMNVQWLDVCCGQGKALLQTAQYLAENNLQGKASLIGIDIIDAFLPIPPMVKCLSFKVASIVEGIPVGYYDLITCVHGLHYVGDKLKAIATAIGALNAGGLFIANLDLDSIKIEGENDVRYLKDTFRKNGMTYNARTKILSCREPKMMDFGLHYQGANDKAGPNYTGQEAVNSHYKILATL